MYYSVIRVQDPMILLEDSFGDLQVFTKDFFDWDVQENDLAYLENGMFHLAKEETEKTKQENFDRMNSLFDK
ncbi:MAG: hypothetical protein IKV52_02680 [Oscillospiraceae bacterium]|nr:hypothetical protein [Oscillospiraceae bacterium]